LVQARGVFGDGSVNPVAVSAESLVLRAYSIAKDEVWVKFDAKKHSSSFAEVP